MSRHADAAVLGKDAVLECTLRLAFAAGTVRIRVAAVENLGETGLSCRIERFVP